MRPALLAFPVRCWRCYGRGSHPATADAGDSPVPDARRRGAGCRATAHAEGTGGRRPMDNSGKCPTVAAPKADVCRRRTAR
jgi:hypothetical protein